MTQTMVSQTAIHMDEERELGFGTMLVAESEEGGYELVAMVNTIQGARELADENLKIRMNELERGYEPMWPARCVVWGRMHRGAYRIICTIDA